MADDATIKFGADVGGAIAGLLLVEMEFKRLDTIVLASTALVRKAALAMVAGFAVVGAAAAGLATVGLASAIKTFESYEQTVANAASVTGTVGDEFIATKHNIDEIAKTLGATTVFSAEQAADAMYDLASAGYDVSKMVSGDLKPVLDLAAATQEDLTQTTEIVTAALGQFQLDISHSDRVADVFAKTIGSSKATLDKLGLSFKYVGTIANQFDDNIEDVAGALAIMYNNGLRGEQAGRALRISYGRLSNPTKDVQEVVAALGLTLEDVNPEFHKMSEILHTLNERGITVSQAMKLFGVEAGTGMSAVLDNLPQMDALTESFYNAGGAAEDMAMKQLDTLKGSATLLTSAIENLKIEIGERFAPMIRNLNLFLRDITLTIGEKVDPAFEKFKETLISLEPTLTALVSIWGSVKGILGDVWDMLPFGDSALNSLVNTINTAITAVAIFLHWMDEHPKIVQFALTIGLAVAAFSFIYPVVTAAATAIGAMGIAWGILTGIMTGSIPVFGSISALLLSIEWPLVLIAGLIAILAAAWITNFGGIREITKEIVNDIVDGFWWMMEQLFDVTNALVRGINKIRDFLGMEKIEPLVFDVDRAKQAFSDMKSNAEIVWEDFSVSDYLGIEGIDVEGLMTVEELTSQIAENTAQIAENNERAWNVPMATADTYYAQNIAEREMLGRSTRMVTEPVSYGSATEAKDARERGEIRQGDVYTINIDTISTDASTGEELMDDIIDSAKSVGS